MSENLKYKALIVDDESLARQLVRTYLSQRNDVEVVGECKDGFECLKFIAEQKVDILFLDVQMPKINGFELLEVLKENPM
jgi:two-component system LytT family response regulator